MNLEKFSSGGILGIIFRHINESPRTLAELYVYRDRTLIYKWFHDSATPSKGLVPGIVAFVMEKTCEPVRLSIRKELDDYVNGSDLRPEIVAQLTATIPFQKFIEDIFQLSISLPTDEKRTMKAQTPQHTLRGGHSIPLLELALALMAVLGGGMLWNGINRLLGWTYYMGGEGREPRGVAAAVWGLVVTVPIILAALASRYKGDRRAGAANGLSRIAVTVLYALSGLIGSLVFYNMEVRAYIEGFIPGYGLRELAIGFSFASLVSLLPLVVIVMADRISGKAVPHGFALAVFALLPPLLVIAAVSFTLFIARPTSELEQLRGLLAGLMLRTGMYLVARGSLPATFPKPCTAGR